MCAACWDWRCRPASLESWEAGGEGGALSLRPFPYPAGAVSCPGAGSDSFLGQVPSNLLSFPACDAAGPQVCSPLQKVSKLDSLVSRALQGPRSHRLARMVLVGWLTWQHSCRPAPRFQGFGWSTIGTARGGGVRLAECRAGAPTLGWV